MHAGHVQQYVRLSMSIVTQRVNLRPRLIFLALLAQMQLFISFSFHDLVRISFVLCTYVLTIIPSFCSINNKREEFKDCHCR